MSHTSIEEWAGQATHGTAVPVLRRTVEASAQLLGTMWNRRGRWNPFLPENCMDRQGSDRAIFFKEVYLTRHGGRHGDGVYALRFCLNHDLRGTLKADHQALDGDGRPKLVSGDSATQAQNVMIRAQRDGVHRITLDADTGAYAITPGPEYLTKIESMQLNGFVWDDESMFEKFDERRSNHQMKRAGDWWVLTVPLKKNGGISFREDGVYQFLFSANGNEDWGFGGDNEAPGWLSGGTGFGSSGGRLRHSALTIVVSEDAEYSFRVHPNTYRWEVVAPEGVKTPQLLNRITAMQLLGSVHTDENQFDPTNPEHEMEQVGPLVWRKAMELSPDVYTVNFAISEELFLDTMALGAWLTSSTPHRLEGCGWHGKPNEPNVLFEVLEPGSYVFTYDGAQDRFTIEAVSPKEAASLRPITKLDSLHLVGSFDDDLAPWDPTSAKNAMRRLGPSLFQLEVPLQAGRRYDYKYTANRLPWRWVFADYELDGYGTDFEGANPNPSGSTLADLKRFGHLTTHADPPTLSFTPQKDGSYIFTVDLENGAYSVQPAVR
jgi:hypothetical protein